MDPGHHTVTPTQLFDLLLDVAVVRPVFIWGQPGVGKTALVEKFASELGMPYVSLLGTQLAPEDLIGVPQITEAGKSRFCPPELIAVEEPAVILVDEANGASADVQKAFYSLIHEQRVGSYQLPEGSVVLGAGNRANDQAIVRTMSSALVNRMIHVHLVSSTKDWLVWAAGEGQIHPLVLDYIRHRPDHLCVPPPKTERTFSTPRSWHMLSDALVSLEAAGEGPVDLSRVSVVAAGCVSPEHAEQFIGYAKAARHRYDIDQLLKGKLSWPSSPGEADVRHFLAQSFAARLRKELPATKDAGSQHTAEYAHRAKALLVELASLDVELAKSVVVAAEGEDVLPDWFLNEVIRDVPRLADRS